MSSGLNLTNNIRRIYIGLKELDQKDLIPHIRLEGLNQKHWISRIISEGLDLKNKI